MWLDDGVTNTQTISPTETNYWADFTSEVLSSIVAKYTEMACQMIGTLPGQDAMAIANAAWGQLALRDAL